MAGRKPKPTKLKVIEGNPGKRSLPKVEIPPEPMDPAPDFLDDIGKAEWERKTKMLDALGVLHNLDHATLALWCATYSRAVRAEQTLRQLEEQGGTLAGLLVKQKYGYAPSPLTRIVAHCVGLLNAMAPNFYFNPVSRVKLENSEGALSPKKGSKFEGLIGKDGK